MIQSVGTLMQQIANIITFCLLSSSKYKLTKRLLHQSFQICCKGQPVQSALVSTSSLNQKNIQKLGRATSETSTTNMSVLNN